MLKKYLTKVTNRYIIVKKSDFSNKNKAPPMGQGAMVENIINFIVCGLLALILIVLVIYCAYSAIKCLARSIGCFVSNCVRDGFACLLLVLGYFISVVWCVLVILQLLHYNGYSVGWFEFLF